MSIRSRRANSRQAGVWLAAKVKDHTRTGIDIGVANGVMRSTDESGSEMKLERAHIPMKVLKRAADKSGVPEK
jgi:hypothetical protein